MKIGLVVLDCSDCGKCCEEIGTPPMLMEEYYALPIELQWERTDTTNRRYDNGLPCLWYDVQTKRCKHYEHRPEVCKQFEVGEDGCLHYRNAD